MIEDYFKQIDSPLKAYMLGVVVYNHRLLDNKKIMVELILNDDFPNSKVNNYLRNVDKIKLELNNLGECVYNVNNNSLVLTKIY